MKDKTMSYVALRNFKDGNQKEGWTHYKIGQDYSGINAKMFLKEGIIADKAKTLDVQIAQVMNEIEAKHKELELLQSKVDTLRSGAKLKAEAKAKEILDSVKETKKG